MSYDSDARFDIHVQYIEVALRQSSRLERGGDINTVHIMAATRTGQL